jgi:hypothetical protein
MSELKNNLAMNYQALHLHHSMVSQIFFET